MTSDKRRQTETSKDPFRLIAAVFTPMNEDGSLNPAQARTIADRMAEWDVDGIFVCGSTGEGPSLSTEERKATAEAYVQAAAGRLQVIVHVGHNSLTEAQDLAAHAERIGAHAIAATAPYYFKPASTEALVDFLVELAAAAGDMPFYYYHIPVLTGVELDMLEFLRAGAQRLKTLAGVKYTLETLGEFQACVEFEGGRFEMLFGRDEMLLPAMAAGARGAVGTTYGFAAPLYHRLIDAFRRGDVAAARRCQSLSATMIRAARRHELLASAKSMMNMIGLNCGPVRPPIVPLSESQRTALEQELRSIGFFDWAR